MLTGCGSISDMNPLGQSGNVSSLRNIKVGETYHIKLRDSTKTFKRKTLCKVNSIYRKRNTGDYGGTWFSYNIDFEVMDGPNKGLKFKGSIYSADRQDNNLLISWRRGSLGNHMTITYPRDFERSEVKEYDKSVKNGLEKKYYLEGPLLYVTEYFENDKSGFQLSYEKDGTLQSVNYYELTDSSSKRTYEKNYGWGKLNTLKIGNKSLYRHSHPVTDIQKYKKEIDTWEAKLTKFIHDNQIDKEVARLKISNTK